MLDELSDSYQSNLRDVQRLERDISDAQRDRPSFSELGTAFEDALNLAESQAAKLVSDALTEANATTLDAANTVRTLRDSTDLEVNSMLSDAQTAASEIALRTEQEVARLRNSAVEEAQQIQSELIKAERIAAQLISDAEREIADLQQRANREIDESRRNAMDELRKANEYANELKFEVHGLRSDADQKIANIRGEAEGYAAKTYVDADNHSEVSVERAAMVSKEADEYVATMQTRSEAVLHEARERANALSEHVMTLANELSTSSGEFVSGFTHDLAKQIAEARRQQDEMTRLSHALKVTVNGFDLGELRLLPNPVIRDTSLVAEIVEE